MMQTKECRKCKQTLMLECFPPRANSADGRRNDCRKCKGVYDSRRPPQMMPVSNDLAAVGAALVGWRGPVSVGVAPMGRAW